MLRLPAPRGSPLSPTRSISRTPSSRRRRARPAALRPPCRDRRRRRRRPPSMRRRSVVSVSSLRSRAFSFSSRLAARKNSRCSVEQCVEPLGQAEIRAPDRDLVGLERAVGQLDVEQPVVDVGGARPVPIEQEAPSSAPRAESRCLRRTRCSRRRALTTSGSSTASNVFAQFAASGRTRRRCGACRTDAARPLAMRSLHDQSSASSRPLIGFSAPANFG